MQFATRFHRVTHRIWSCSLAHATYTCSGSWILPEELHPSEKSSKTVNQDIWHPYKGGAWRGGDTTGEYDISASIRFMTQKRTLNHCYGCVWSANRLGLGGSASRQDEKATTYWSGVLIQADQNYDTGHWECLVVWAVLLFRPYLEGQRFTIHTENDALQGILNQLEVTGRMVRWRLQLYEFVFDVIHRTGIKNRFAEVLSRAETIRKYITKLKDDSQDMMVSLVEKGGEKIKDVHNGNSDMKGIG